jgi:hypothetical protein
LKTDSSCEEIKTEEGKTENENQCQSHHTSELAASELITRSSSIKVMERPRAIS